MIKELRLKNGFRCFLWPNETQNSVTVMITVKIGSIYETKENNGISHFLEHMYFKGSKKFPSAKELHYILEKYGALVNAATSYESTSFFSIIPSQSLEFILEVWSDILNNPLFPEEEIEKERRVIIEEINMYEDDPQRQVAENLFSALFKNQPAGYPIAGTKQSIQRLTRDDLLKFYQKCYSAKNSFLVITGNFEISKKLIKVIEKLFSNFPIKPLIQPPKTFKKPNFEVNLQTKKNLQQAHFVLGFAECFDKLPSLKERILISHLVSIIGRGFSSRLFQVLREEISAAYYNHAFSEICRDHLVVAFAAGLDFDKFELACYKIAEIIKDIKEKGITDEELFKSKNMLENSLICGLETSISLAHFISDHLVLGDKIPSLKEIRNLIKATTKKEINDLAKRLFLPQKAASALIFKESAPSLKKEIIKIFQKI